MLREIANALVRINLMKTFKTLIVDDEWLIRLELKRLLSEYPNIIVVGEAANLTEATRAVDEQKPDLIFLDIQMPGGSGFDFLEQVQGDFKIIFVTAFTHHRQNAGKYRAVDYLLKPISKERLARALQELMNSAGD
ncbi:MAG: Transcriptional regulatory protein BtsR [bacterium]|nr:Transcriptional regulatory protein BtsR [bacterium]